MVQLLLVALSIRMHRSSFFLKQVSLSFSQKPKSSLKTILDNTEMTSLVIGDEIRVVIDYGHAIDSNYQLSIKSCSLAASNQQLNLITGIIPNSDLKGLVKASNSTSNSQAEFEMHVFTIGDDSTATIQCDMFFEILSSTVTSSSTVAPLADTSITEAFTTPIEVLFEEYTTSPILQVSLDEDLSHVTQLNSTTGDSGESLPSSWTSSPNISCELQNASFTYEKIDSGDNGVININGTFVNGLSCFVPFAETCTNLIAVQITSLSIDPRDVGRAYGDNGSYNFTNENHPSDNNGILTYEEKCYDTIHFQYTRSNQTMFTIPQCGCLEHDQADCSQYYDEIKFGTPTTTRSHIFNGTDAKLIVNTDNVVPSEHLSFNWECKDNLNDFSHVTQLDSSAPISTFWTGSPNINCETQNASFTYEKNDNGNTGTVNINGTFFNEMSCLVTFAEICTDDITVEITSLSIETRDFIDVVSDDFDNNGLLTYEEKCYDTIHFQYTKNNQTTFTMPQCGCLDYDQEFNQAYSCSPTTIGTHILNGTDAKLIINTDESALSQQITFNWSCDSNDIP